MRLLALPVIVVLAAGVAVTPLVRSRTALASSGAGQASDSSRATKTTSKPAPHYAVPRPDTSTATANRTSDSTAAPARQRPAGHATRTERRAHAPRRVAGRHDGRQGKGTRRATIAPHRTHAPAALPTPPKPVALTVPLVPAVTPRADTVPAGPARITMNWESAPVRDVVSAFSAYARRTILVASGVPNLPITAEVRNEPWPIAMHSVLEANGLAITETSNGILLVDTEDHVAQRANVAPLITETLRLNYQRASTVADFVRQRLASCLSAQTTDGATSGQATQAAASLGLSSARSASTASVEGGSSGACRPRGSVSADSLSNSISVTDVAPSARRLIEYAKGIDLRQPQISIKAKIVLVNRTDLDQFGIKYDIGSPTQHFNTIVGHDGDQTGDPPKISLGGGAIAAMANASSSVPKAALSVVFSTALGGYSLTNFLDALQEVSMVDVQAEPSVTTLNNHTATLISGSQVPFVALTSSGGAGTSIGAAVNVERVQTGVTLRVTPSMTGSRSIALHVEATNSDVDFTASGTVINNQSITNDFYVADGQTIVIGGLTQSSIRVTKSGIPLLVDLPVIGRLFGYHSRQEQRRDLMVLITPTIVDGGETAPVTAVEPTPHVP